MKIDAEGLLAAVADVRERLTGISMRLETTAADDARRDRDDLVAHIDDYLLPRLRSMDAPLLAVVGGSTGAGKSTLVNSLVGNVISPAGVIRPTTTTPIVIVNPADLHWFEEPRVLPELPRLTGTPRQGDFGLYLVADDDVPRGLALLDAPDIDSVLESNRLLASQLLAAADLWLFVTTAARYADGVPWGLLREAHARRVALALVLNRVPQEALEEVPEHLEQMLAGEGFADTTVVTIVEAKLQDGMIPAAELRPLADWVHDLAADAGRRDEVIRQTLEGALATLPTSVDALIAEVEDQISAGQALIAQAETAYRSASGDIEDGLNAGALLRGEVLARWHEFIGTGDFMRNVQSTIGRWRDRVGDALFGRPSVDAEVRVEVGSRIEAAVFAAADKAVERILDQWRAAPEGRALIAADQVPTSSSSGLRYRVDGAVRAWQARVLELVSEQGQDKRAVGRALSLGVNATGAALMITVFAHTGGLSGAEVAVAGGTAALSQRVLEAVFGDQAVRSLTIEARRDLLARLEEVLQAERMRFEEPVRAALPEAETLEALREASTRLHEEISS